MADWLKKASPFFKKIVKTIINWLPEVVGYFERRTNQGMVERIIGLWTNHLLISVVIERFSGVSGFIRFCFTNNFGV